MKKPRKKLEKHIQTSILRWLKRTGLLYWRQSAGLGFVGGRGRRARVRISLGPKGIPDIVVVIPPAGRFIGLEVKSPTGRIRAAQKEFGMKLVSAGASYYIVRSIADAKAAVRKELGEETWSQLSLK